MNFDYGFMYKGIEVKIEMNDMLRNSNYTGFKETRYVSGHPSSTERQSAKDDEIICRAKFFNA